MNFWKVFTFILKCTFVGFGGGNALFPIIKKEAVDKRKWLSKKEFDNLVIATNMIPGPSVVESLSYIAMKQLGRVKGTICTILAILPHIMFAFGLWILAEEYLPVKYLVVLSASVMPVIIGILIAFGIRYIKMSNKELSLPIWIALFLVTISFTLFIPAPWNIPAFVMLGVIILTLIISKIKSSKGGA